MEIHTDPPLTTVRSVFTIVGYALLVFDHVLTLEDEVEYIWPSRRSPVKIIYLGNRYGNIPLLGLVTLHTLGGLYVESAWVRDS